MKNHRLFSKWLGMYGPLCNQLCYRYLLALSLSLATFFPATAQALYQYEYTGNYFTTMYQSYYPDYGDPFPVQGNVSVAFTSDTLLSGGEGFADISGFLIEINGDGGFHHALGWPGPTFDGHPIGVYDGVFTISSVNANGLPTDWNISIDQNLNLPTGRFVQSFIQTSTNQEKTFGEYQGYYSYYGESNNNPGTWSVTPVVPEPQTYAMMMLGLGLVGYMTKRKKS